LKKKLLIFGASGLLGVNFILNCYKQYNISIVINRQKIAFPSIKKYKIDTNKLNQIKNLILRIKPDFIINLIALTDVENCEINKKKAYNLNYVIPKYVAKISKELRIKLIHISTDHIYSSKRQYKTEKYQTDPVNYYAETKLMIEKYITNNLDDFLIIRTNFFGYGPKYRSSFSDFIINNVKKKNKIFLYDNVYFNPVYIKNLIQMILNLAQTNSTGIFNITSNNRISKYEFALLLCKLFKLDSKYILKSRLSFNLDQCKRPLEMSLSNNKISKLLNIDIGNIKKNILMMKNDNKLNYKLNKF